MKIFKSLSLIAVSLFLLSGCEKQDSGIDDPSNRTTKGLNGTDISGIWQRNDGQIAYIKFDGTLASTCANGTITNGTFDASKATATFVINSDKIVFPLEMSGNRLIVKVPAQGTANHVPTEYIKTTSWPCGSSGTGNPSGGGTGTGTGGSTPPAKGQVLVWTNQKENGFLQGFNSMYVSVGGKTGTIYGGEYTSTPSCGAMYCVTASLDPGTYTVSGTVYALKPLVGPTPPNYKTSQTVTVVSNKCVSVMLR